MMLTFEYMVLYHFISSKKLKLYIIHFINNIYDDYLKYIKIYKYFKIKIKNKKYISNLIFGLIDGFQIFIKIFILLP